MVRRDRYIEHNTTTFNALPPQDEPILIWELRNGEYVGPYIGILRVDTIHYTRAHEVTYECKVENSDHLRWKGIVI